MPANLEGDGDSESNRSACMWLCLISLAVIGSIILIGGVVGLFVHYDPLKEVDVVLPRNTPEIRRRALFDDDETITVVLVTKKLNFTQADEYCTDSLDGASLAFPRSFQEEKRFENDLTFQMEENRTHILETCGSQVFIGIRKSVDAQWVLADGSSALTMPALSDGGSGDSDLCSKLSYVDNQVDFVSAECSGNLWNCILCEYRCPDKSLRTCYTVWENINQVDYETASMFCKNIIPRGNLASVNHSSVLELLEDQIRSDAKECRNFGVGNRMISQYESPTEEVIPYKSVRIINMKKMTSGKSCVSMNLNKQMRWEVASCENKYCFVCVKGNVANDDSRSKNPPKPLEND